MLDETNPTNSAIFFFFFQLSYFFYRPILQATTMPCSHLNNQVIARMHIPLSQNKLIFYYLHT